MPRTLTLAALALVLFAGCAPSKSAIESSIREEMKNSMGVQVSAIDLTKMPDGSYTGTATAATGDVYEVQVNAPQGGRTEWKAVPSKSMLEKQISQQIASQVGTQVTSVTLTKTGFGVYTGTAVLANGQRMSLRTFLEGKQIRFEALPAGQ